MYLNSLLYGSDTVLDTTVSPLVPSLGNDISQVYSHSNAEAC